MSLIYKSNFGVIRIEAKNGAVSRVCLSNLEPQDYSGALESAPETELLLEAEKQLEEYFAGKRKIFDLPLSFAHCTDFMTRVYKELININYGETAGYKDIAERVGRPKAYRAVGLASNRNPLAIIVPCHRVVGSDGGLVGYAGGLDMKERLLDMERRKS